MLIQINQIEMYIRDADLYCALGGQLWYLLKKKNLKKKCDICSLLDTRMPNV